MTTTQLYEIRTFEEGYTTPEVVLRRRLEADLIEDLRNYTTEEELINLKEYRATADTFYPENHFYAFIGDELVGFMHFWPRYQEDTADVAPEATISVPFTQKSHNLAADTLIEAVVHRAKVLGVKDLSLVIDSRNLRELDTAHNLGFSFDRINRLTSQLKIAQLEINSKNHFEIENFDIEQDQEGVLQLYEDLGYPRTQIENQFSWLTDLGNRLLSWIIVRRDGNIVGQAVAFQETDSTLAQLNVVTKAKEMSDYDYREMVNDVFASHLTKLQKADITEVELNILENALDVRPIYEGLGFEFTQTDYYTKSIDTFRY